MPLLHVDTDVGGDPDDVAALAMLAGWPDVRLHAVTTTIDPGGVRAGYARYCLGLLGLTDVPVAAGAETSMSRRTVAEPLRELWPEGIPASPDPPGAAPDLLAQSVQAGATVVAIGPLTNLALLELTRPGLLRRVPLVVMGGWVRTPGSGLPAYGPERDWNIAWDLDAARFVLEAAGELTLVTLADTLRTWVRAGDLPRLRAAGAIGDLLARQAGGYARLRDHATLARAHAGLPDDLLHFLHDPLACAVAVGWPGVTVQEQRLRAEVGDGALRLVPDAGGRPARLVTDVDGTSFAQRWLSAVESAAQS